MSEDENPDGTWKSCNLEECNNIFFRYNFSHKRFSISDKMGVCNLCIRDKQIENGTLPKKDGNISDFVKHRHDGTKPNEECL